MKNLKNTGFLKGKSDSGAALALVLLMVVFLSLWLSSVFLFTASSSKAVDSNIAKSQAQEATMNSALEAALTVLNSPGQYLGATAVTNAAGASSCSNANLSYTTASGTVISVTCSQAANSGVTGPIASFVLTGTGTNCGSTCVVGVNGGLAITTSNTGCTSQGTVKVAGGFFVSAGVVSGVNACTLQLNTGTGSNTTTIVTPTGGNNNFTGGTSPTNVNVNNGNTGGGTTTAPTTQIASTNGNVNSPNSQMQFLQKTQNAKLDKAPTIGGVSGVKNAAGLATLQGTCTAPVSRTWTGGDGASHTLSAVWLNTSSYTTTNGNYWGWIDDATMAKINSYVTPCATANVPLVFAAYDGTKMRTDKGAVFRLQPNSATSPRYELYLKDGVRFSSGVPLMNGNTIAGCDTKLPGNQIQFADASFLRVGESKSWFCDPTTLNANYETQAHACAAPLKLQSTDDFSWNNVNSLGQSLTNSAGTTDLIYMDAENSTHVASYNSNPSNYDKEGSDDAGNLSAAEKRTLATKYLGRTATDTDVQNLETGNDATSKAYRAERTKSESQRSTWSQNRDDYKVQTGLTDLNFEGSCYAPAASVHLEHSSYVKSEWAHGATFMAESIHIGTIKSGDNLAPLSMQSQNLDSGNRQVELKMYDQTHKVNGQPTFLGAFNVVIDDKFGYTNRIGSDYKIKSRVIAGTNH